MMSGYNAYTGSPKDTKYKYEDCLGCDEETMHIQRRFSRFMDKTEAMVEQLLDTPEILLSCTALWIALSAVELFAILCEHVSFF